MRISSLFIIVLCILSSCDLIREKEQPNITPWGEVIEDDDDENAVRHIMNIADMDLACIISFVRSLRKS